MFMQVPAVKEPVFGDRRQYIVAQESLSKDCLYIDWTCCEIGLDRILLPDMPRDTFLTNMKLKECHWLLREHSLWIVAKVSDLSPMKIKFLSFFDAANEN